jgi:hypothetical protein
MTKVCRGLLTLAASRQVDGSESEVKGRQHCVKKNVSDIQVFVPNTGTSGTTIHKVVLDPTVHHAVKLVPSDRLVDTIIRF